MAGSLDFWFDFSSTYSHLSAQRIEGEAHARGVTLRWRPFLLGPIFVGQGMTDSPFNLYPVKGHYMWRDMERRAAKFGLRFRRPDAFEGSAFPRRSVLAARVAMAVIDEPWAPEFCRQVYDAEFVDWLDIADPAVIDRCLALARGSDRGFTAGDIGDGHKAALKANVDEVMALGIFGAPSFVAGGEIFWGDDRLEDALDWAARTAVAKE